MGVLARCRSLEGKDNLFHRFDRILTQMRIRHGSTRFIIVPDLHPQESLVDEIERWRSRVTSKFPDAEVCFAVWEIEAWLLADPESIKAEFGITCKAPNPDQIGGQPPSDLLYEAFQRGKGIRKKAPYYHKGKDGSRLAAVLDIDKAYDKSPSLARFLTILGYVQSG